MANSVASRCFISMENEMKTDLQRKGYSKDHGNRAALCNAYLFQCSLKINPSILAISVRGQAKTEIRSNLETRQCSRQIGVFSKAGFTVLALYFVLRGQALIKCNDWERTSGGEWIGLDESLLWSDRIWNLLSGALELTRACNFRLFAAVK